MDMDLRNIFDPNSGFREWRRYCMDGQRDGMKVGAALATKNKGYDNFALNCADLDHLEAGKSNGKVDEAYVVFVKLEGNKRVYAGKWTLEEARQKTSWLEPRSGRYGDAA